MKNLLTIFMSVVSGAKLIGLVNAVLEQSYDLIVIDESDTPLGSGPVNTNYYILAVCTVALAALLAFMVLFVTRRNGLKKRLLELRKRAGNEDMTVPFSIRELKDAVAEAEANLSAELL